MAPPRFRLARAHKKAIRTSGNITLNSAASWANVDNGLDLVLAARVGDDIQVEAGGYWGAGAAYGHLDVVSLVSGSPVNSWATQGAPDNGSAGISSWLGVTGVESVISGGWIKTIVAGDLSNGLVTLRLRGSTDVATNKVLFASTVVPFMWWAKNLSFADAT